MKMATTKIKCCGKLHAIIQFTHKGPIQYGAECSKCGKRVAAETPEALRRKWGRYQVKYNKTVNTIRIHDDRIPGNDHRPARA